MYRFLLPAFVMISAIVVLLAGALGGVPSLSDLTGEWAAYFTSLVPEHTASSTGDSTHVASVAAPTLSAAPAASPTAPVPSTTTPAASVPSTTTPAASMPPPTPTTPDDQANQHPASDTLRQQAAELQGQIAQRSRELASLNSSKDQARHELDALHQQRQTEETAISQLQAQQKQMAATAPQETPARPQPAAQPAPTPSDNTSVQAALARLRATAQHPRRQVQPAPSRRVASQPEQVQTPRDDLENARNLLVSGRSADARQLLVLAQAQSQLHPVTPDQPFATGGSLTATRISDAIRFLDRGNTRYALRAINMAMDSTTTATSTWPAYPSSPPQGNQYPPQPVYR